MEMLKLSSGTLASSASDVSADEGCVLVSRKTAIFSHAFDTFDKLRVLDKISTEDMVESLDPEKNRNKVFQAGEGAGASGSFFFFSSDNKFIIKTMSDEERATMLSNLEQFVDHFKAFPNSLLAKIYGIYTVYTDRFTPVNILVMQNVANLRNK